MSTVAQMPVQDAKLVFGADDPQLPERLLEVFTSAWPAFILNDPVGSRYWVDLYLNFPEYQCALLHPDSGDVLAVGNSIPLVLEDGLRGLPEEGWSWAIEKSLRDFSDGNSPNTQCALAVTVPLARRGKGIGLRMIRAMKQIGLDRGLRYFVVPVRPNTKARYPLTPMETFARWKNENGLPFDPWMRVHARAGATILKPCLRSLQISGCVSEWEDWAGMRFPSSGAYVVPQALVPVTIDRERDRGTYDEPNVWMNHPMRP